MRNQEIATARLKVKRCANAPVESDAAASPGLTQADCRALVYLFEEKPDAFISKDLNGIVAVILCGGGVVRLGDEVPASDGGVVACFDGSAESGAIDVHFKEGDEIVDSVWTIRHLAVAGVVVGELPCGS